MRTELDTVRVAHVIDTLNVGGAETLLVEQARQGAAAGIDSTVIGLRPGASSQLSDDLRAVGAEVRLIGSNQRHQLLDLQRLGRLTSEIRDGGFDVVHTHLRVSTIVGSLAGRRAGVPVVSTLHNVRTDVGAGVEDRVKDVLETTALRRWVDVVIGCGPVVAESNRGRVGQRPLVVVPNPVREISTPTGADRERLRHELLGDGDELVVSVGRLAEQKDYPNLLRAMRELDARGRTTRLVVVGEGEERATLEAAVARDGLADRVLLVGNRPDVAAVLSAADVFVLSSAWEGLPLVLLEAMAVGAPIVATDVGDVSGVVGDTASVVPPRDHRALAGAIAALLDDPVEAERLGSLARQRVRERHSSRAWVEQLRGVYEQALRR
jgi:glycosyltransferase involved in cell wall biosynthesis